MLREVLISKIHRATVTDANVDYVGSISIDEDLMRASDIHENEAVHVWDVTNGARLITYAMRGKKGEICLNGAAARLITRGDIVIIACFGYFQTNEIARHKPKLVYVDDRNRIKDSPH